MGMPSIAAASGLLEKSAVGQSGDARPTEAGVASPEVAAPRCLTCLAASKSCSEGCVMQTRPAHLKPTLYPQRRLSDRFEWLHNFGKLSGGRNRGVEWPPEKGVRREQH